MSGVLIIRYAVKLASNEIELCLARHDNDQDGGSPGAALGRNRKSMKIGPNPARSSVLVNFDAYFRGSGHLWGRRTFRTGDDRARPVPSGEVYGS